MSALWPAAARRRDLTDAMAAPWSAPPCRRFGQRRLGAAISQKINPKFIDPSYQSKLRHVAAGQSADKAAHSKEPPLTRGPGKARACTKFFVKFSESIHFHANSNARKASRGANALTDCFAASEPVNLLRRSNRENIECSVATPSLRLLDVSDTCADSRGGAPGSGAPTTLSTSPIVTRGFRF